MKLSENLKNIRKENNLSQEQLAEKLGVSRQAVSKWESEQSYPEMDKVLLICKLFNYNIDELMNENVKIVSEEKQAKNNVKEFIEDFLNFISKTVDMFSSFKFGQKIKCLFELCFIAFVLFVAFGLLGVFGSSIFNGLFIRIIPYNAYLKIHSILDSIYMLFALVTGITIMLHIFKTRYLDYYEIVKVTQEKEMKDAPDASGSSDTSEVKEVQINDNKKVTLEKKQEKIIIRDPEHSDSKFLTGVMKFILWCIKFGVGCIAAGFACSFVGLVCALVLSFVFAKTGFLFAGAFLGIVGALLINYVILEVLFNFIISKKNNNKRNFIIIIVALIIAGIGAGLIPIGVSKIDYVADYSAENSTETSAEFEMSDKLMVEGMWNNFEYVPEERENIKVVVTAPKFINPNIFQDKNYIHIMFYDGNFMEVLRTQIDSINNDGKIIDFDIDPEIRVYGSQKNIDILKKNYEDSRKDTK